MLVIGARSTPGVGVSLESQVAGNGCSGCLGLKLFGMLLPLLWDRSLKGRLVLGCAGQGELVLGSAAGALCWRGSSMNFGIDFKQPQTRTFSP